jgi:hypothetical protein
LLAKVSSRASCWLGWWIYRISSNFTKFAKGFLKPSPYLALLGRETMSGVTFNRNRAKLKKLLGIRARLALLAVILVAPLMLERARSLEDTRTKQIAAASGEFANLTQHSADAQREVISSVETMLKSAAYIRASGGIARSCEVLRASLPGDLPWIRSIAIVSRDGLVQCSTLNSLVGLNLADRDYFKQARQTGGFVFSDFLLAKTNSQPVMVKVDTPGAKAKGIQAGYLQQGKGRGGTEALLYGPGAKPWDVALAQVTITAARRANVDA